MNHSRSHLQQTRIVLAVASLIASFICVLAQGDTLRETVAITYPLDQTINVRFRGTERLPRLSGDAKVRRSGRRGTRVEFNVHNLPRASELGSIYTTYVLWAISPEGRADNLGEIKRDGSFLSNSKLDVTTPLQTFALIVTAEPHFLMHVPSRMVVAENLPPRDPGSADVVTASVRYIGNTSDYFNDRRVPDAADADLTRTPISLLGARQAINLARYAGAERDAPTEYKAAVEQLAHAENAWRLKQSDEEIDAEARNAIRLGASAEDVAAEHKAARLRREEIARRDEAVREAEKTADTAAQEIAELKSALDKSERAREMSDRDLVNANQQLRDLRSEVARLRDELTQTRAEAEDTKVRLARMEGEKSAEDARKAAEQRAVQQREAVAAFKQTLGRYGAVRETNRGLVLVLPESLWASARAAELSPNAAAMVEPLAALFANNPNYQINIEAYTDGRGDQIALRKLTQDRAEVLAQRIVSAGVDGARVQASGMGAENPVAPNITPAGRSRNRRTEIILVPLNPASAAANQ